MRAAFSVKRNALACAALLCLLAALAGAATAQTGTAAQGPRIQIYGGPSFLRYTVPSGVTTYGSSGHLNFLGWTASGEYYIFHWLAAQAELSGNYSYSYSSSYGSSGHMRTYAGLIGPVIYPLGHRHLTPFVHALFGEDYAYEVTPAYGPFSRKSYSTFAKAYELGGGLDLTLKRRWAIRLIQADYSQANLQPSTSSPFRQNMVRFSAGVIYRIGQH